MTRLDDVFTVLKVVRRGVDATHDLAERAIQNAAADRALADRWVAGCDAPNVGSEPGVIHALCLRLIDERETLAQELECIRRDLDNAGIVPRTRNLGEAARGTVTPAPKATQ